MYTKAVKWLTIGDILAEDIVVNNKIVFTIGTVVTLGTILKLQSFGIQYVKVSSSPFLTSKVDDVVNGDDYNRIETIFYNFIIQNNKNFRYSLLLEEVENLKFITNQAINVTNEEILNLLAALKSWDIYSLNHVVDVFIIGSLWMRDLGLHPNLEDSTGLLLHDIGKIKIPRDILLKKGALTSDEFNTLKLHTIYGAEILKQLNYPNTVYEMAMYHHIRLNDSGYPKPFPEQLDDRVKMLMIVDVFSALTLDRPYREAFNFQDSINILLSEKDGFDKDLLHHFVEFIGRNLTLTTLL
ncbi:HD-GYP domain-containing protein [Bacillus andreraoultii]|uniref:HD-GYP domain-containing protein n=1 Tax=Bacillus andreraoultii TaxID=1499685 RepID=UPI00053974B7|nr:HD domain-containing phosphohydrolase [Bacillus andreraoultii]